LLARARGIAADLCAQLDHRLMHLRLDPLFQNDFAAGNNLLNMRTQLPRLRINDLEFFLNPESKNVIDQCGSKEIVADKEVLSSREFEDVSRKLARIASRE
jgi:hypothetical protein